jgi:Spy/CpxP family protein refolding chaperone
MTRTTRVLTLSLFATVAAATCLLAAAGDATRSPRLTRPWSQLEGLSDEQREQIAEIHRQALADIRAIQQRERRQIMGLLTQEQLHQLRDLEDRETVARKLRNAPATAPAETP